MAQFEGGKYSESGVLSYNYLGGEGGAGKGPVSIKKRGDSWYFVDKQGKVKNALGNGGKLTPTHMQNLERDGIFKNAKVNPETGGSFKGAEPTPTTTAGDNVGIDSNGNLTGGSASVQATPLAESKYSLAETQGVRPAPQISSNTQEAVVPQVAPDRTISGVRSSFSDMADGSAVSDGTFTTSNFGGNKPMGVGDNYSLPSSTVIPQSSGGSSEYTDKFGPGTPKQSSYGGSEFQDKHGRGWGEYNPDAPTYAVNTSNAQTPFAGTSEYADKGGIRGGIDPDYSQSNMAPDAMQGSTTPGITDKKDGGWGAADWNAAGSVMKGVGGLYGAWTGMKNYQLARDAHNAQKNQWQANYNQQLKTYEDNKKLANQDIQSRNRTLRARNKTRTDTYSELQ